MYEPPIRIIEQISDVIKSERENSFKCFIRENIEVDEKELMAALHYDRKQYEKGYEDGKRDAVRHGHWELQYPEDKNCGLLKCPCCRYEYGDLFECTNYCGNCGAKMDEPLETKDDEK